MKSKSKTKTPIKCVGKEKKNGKNLRKKTHKVNLSKIADYS